MIPTHPPLNSSKQANRYEFSDVNLEVLAE